MKQLNLKTIVAFLFLASVIVSCEFIEKNQTPDIDDVEDIINWHLKNKTEIFGNSEFVKLVSIQKIHGRKTREDNYEIKIICTYEVLKPCNNHSDNTRMPSLGYLPLLGKTSENAYYKNRDLSVGQLIQEGGTMSFMKTDDGWKAYDRVGDSYFADYYRSK
jgi:hypothetical protein